MLCAKFDGSLLTTKAIVKRHFAYFCGQGVTVSVAFDVEFCETCIEQKQRVFVRPHKASGFWHDMQQDDVGSRRALFFIFIFCFFLFPLLLTSVIILIFFYSFVIFCTVYLE